MSVNELCFRALDHRHERSDPKIIRNLASHLESGVLSRKERYGEFFGRVLSGMFRQPQSDIYIASPKDFNTEFSTSSSPADIRHFLDWFDREHESAHRVYLALCCPTMMDRYKQRQHVIHADKTSVNERLIVGCVIRTQLVKQVTQEKIYQICGEHQLPVTII